VTGVHVALPADSFLISSACSSPPPKTPKKRYLNFLKGESYIQALWFDLKIGSFDSSKDEKKKKDRVEWPWKTDSTKGR